MTKEEMSTNGRLSEASPPDFVDPVAATLLTPSIRMPLIDKPSSPPSAKLFLPPEICVRESGEPISSADASPSLTPNSRLHRVDESIINTMRETHRARADLLRSEGNLTRTSKSIIKRAVGFNNFLPEKERKLKIAEADRIYKSICAGIFNEDTFVAAIATRAHLASRNAITEQLGPLEKSMQRLAKQLPVAPFVESVNGFGWIGLAQIIGEAGDLSNYANPAKLWKRFGLGLISSGERQRKFTDAAKAEEAGYSPIRRSLMFVIGDSLLKKQGPYRDLYLARKVYEEAKAPTLTKMAWHRRAQRYMEKRLLRELWRAWNHAPEVTQ